MIVDTSAINAVLLAEPRTAGIPTQHKLNDADSYVLTATTGEPVLSAMTSATQPSTPPLSGRA